MNTLEAIKQGQDHEKVVKIIDCLIKLDNRQHSIRMRILGNDYITKHVFRSKREDLDKLEWYAKVEQKLNNYKLKLNKTL